jgi:hypothetical protein
MTQEDFDRGLEHQRPPLTAKPKHRRSHPAIFHGLRQQKQRTSWPFYDIIVGRSKNRVSADRDSAIRLRPSQRLQRVTATGGAQKMRSAM